MDAALRWIGRFEYFVAGPRDALALVWGALALASWGMAQTPASLAALPIILFAASRLTRRFALERAVQKLLRNPDAHPRDYFEALYRAYSIWPEAREVRLRDVDPADLDFTDRRRPRSARFALARAFVDTARIASIVLYASRRLAGPEFVRLFDASVRLWSTRTAYHLCLRLRVEGLEHLAAVRSQALVVLNHESYMDFALAFYAVGGTTTRRGRRIRARFLAARDHFYDNVFIHSVLGVGKAMVAAGMIFVDRHTRGAARGVIDDSVAAMRREDVDLALFPQGTRAPSHYGPDGRPLRAGYYTTARVPGQRHFKRGAAAIAIDLARLQPVDVVCVGIIDTARVVPARRLVVSTHQTVQYRILPPIRLEPTDPTVDEADLLLRFDRCLRKAADVHERLLDGWAVEAEANGVDAGPKRRAALAAHLEAWNDEADPIPYATLDWILTRPKDERAAPLAQWLDLVESAADRAAWETFRTSLVAP